MSDGNIVYQGPAAESPDYFKGLGAEMPMFCNPADVFMKILSTANLRKMKYNQEKTQRMLDYYTERTGKKMEFDQQLVKIEELPDTQASSAGIGT